jgi:hypothetical protein
MWYETMHRPLMKTNRIILSLASSVYMTKMLSGKRKDPTVQVFCSYKNLRLLTELITFPQSNKALI